MGDRPCHRKRDGLRNAPAIGGLDIGSYNVPRPWEVFVKSARNILASGSAMTRSDKGLKARAPEQSLGMRPTSHAMNDSMTSCRPRQLHSGEGLIRRLPAALTSDHELKSSATMSEGAMQTPRLAGSSQQMCQPLSFYTCTKTTTEVARVTKQ